MDVRWHTGAKEELCALPAKERAALLNAEEKLIALGQLLGSPHISAVRGSRKGLREPRPRRGNSPSGDSSHRQNLTNLRDAHFARAMRLP